MVDNWAITLVVIIAQHEVIKKAREHLFLHCTVNYEVAQMFENHSKSLFFYKIANEASLVYFYYKMCM